jgi:hypothetical protein
MKTYVFLLTAETKATTGNIGFCELVSQMTMATATKTTPSVPSKNTPSDTSYKYPVRRHCLRPPLFTKGEFPEPLERGIALAGGKLERPRQRLKERCLSILPPAKANAAFLVCRPQGQFAARKGCRALAPVCKD